MRKEHFDQISCAVEALKEKETVNAVYFVACGGSQAVLMAGQYIFDKETNVPSHVYTANEFVYDTPASLNEHSLVISCSHSGNTPETVSDIKKALAYRDARAMQAESKLFINALFRRSTYFALP